MTERLRKNPRVAEWLKTAGEILNKSHYTFEEGDEDLITALSNEDFLTMFPPGNNHWAFVLTTNKRLKIFYHIDSKANHQDVFYDNRGKDEELVDAGAIVIRTYPDDRSPQINLFASTGSVTLNYSPSEESRALGIEAIKHFFSARIGEESIKVF